MRSGYFSTRALSDHAAPLLQQAPCVLGLGKYALHYTNGYSLLPIHITTCLLLLLANLHYSNSFTFYTITFSHYSNVVIWSL